ncbi:MAG: D-alanyl-D-alanine carboxypeptidase family protein [Pigmentiphaga sp.]|uniref:D-alanyl-D-alanine carboxypeptidase family protein n=1 Tax=Pigmentiphaga sp. TaxID=1977564 RepID=UPI0029B1E243|nr:D-alanyl-D-alanine carboxypeptidase family protein [Pigmentiphaga sp.]MDX3904785.1 D-alanyl-D-alanine carboxypeptidase family protein [Pigmentiphaga sp.]
MPITKIAAGAIGLALCLHAAYAQTPSPAPVLSARAWLLLDAASGDVLGSREPDTRIEPASLTKLMTAYVVFEALQDRTITLDRKVTVSKRAWQVAPGSSKMFLEPGTQVSIEELLYGLLVQSGNDAAIALAEAVAGSVEAFVARMNEQAGELGLVSTHFSNPHGLPDPGTYSTARDLSVLAVRLVRDFPGLAGKYDATKQYTYNRITQPNRNRLLWLDPSVDGMKTGHTTSAGYSLIATARRPDHHGPRRLISVVVGTASDRARTEESRTLLEWGFRNFETVRVYKGNEAVAIEPVWKGARSTVPVGFTRDIYVSVPAGARVERVLRPATPLVAPLAVNAPAGEVQVRVNGQAVRRMPLVTLQPVSPASWAGRTWDGLRLWLRAVAGMH